MSADRDLFGRNLPDIASGRGQLPLPLGWHRAGDGGDKAFIVGESNAIAARYLTAVHSWPTPVTALIGPARSGRSMLAEQFGAHSGGDVIEGADRADQQQLFNAWNHAQTANRPLLLIATLPVAGWSISLPDLRTRLSAVPTVTIDPPDLLLAAALIERLLEQRGLKAEQGIGRYAADRIERSYAAIHATVDAVQREQAARGGRITTATMRAALVGHHLVAPQPTPSSLKVI